MTTVSQAAISGIRVHHDGSSESVVIDLPDMYWDKFSTGHPGPPYTFGDRFWTHKSGTSYNSSSGTALYPADGYYTGGFIIQPAVALIPVEVPVDDYGAFSEGAHAWDRAKSKLTGPSFSPVQDLVEIKETVEIFKSLLKDLGHVWRNRGGLQDAFRESVRRTKLRGVADANLMTQFGVLPLIDDVRKYVKAMRDAQNRAHKIISGNGRSQKVSGSLHNISASVSDVINPASAMGLILPALHPFAIQGELKATVSASLINSSWFSGNFVYFLPSVDAMSVPWPSNKDSQRKDLERWLYNDLHFTPKEIYDLIPWSWLLDYFTEVGHVMGAISQGAEESMYADNFFVMNHHEIINITQADFALEQRDGSGHAISLSCNQFGSTKARSRAMPFGFGMNPDSLSDYQSSILLSLAAKRA